MATEANESLSTEDQGNNEKDEEDEHENLRNPRGGPCDASKPKNGSNESDNEESHSVTEHEI